MSTPEPRMPELALLRELPPEVSLAQVEQWVALFPAAPPPKPWYRNINLNTIIMTTASTLLLGGLLYFLRPGPAIPPVVNASPNPAPVYDGASVTDTFTEPEAVPMPAPVRAEMPEQAPPTTLPPSAALPPAAPVLTPSAPPVPAAAPSAPPSATVQPGASTPAPPPVPGNERRFELEGFTEVVLLGSIGVELHQGPFSVVAVGEADDLERLDVRVKDNALRIKSRTMVKVGLFVTLPSEPNVKLVVHMPKLNMLELEGSGDAVLDRFAGGDDMRMRLSGSGHITLQEVRDVGRLRLEVLGSGRIVCKDAHVKERTDLLMAGSGDIDVAGVTRELNVSLTGSGDIRAGGLAAERGSAEVVGSGDAEVHFTTDQVKTSVVGSGDLKRVRPSHGKE